MINILVNAPFHFIDFSELKKKNSNINFLLNYKNNKLSKKNISSFEGLIVDPGANYKIDKSYLSKFKNLKIIVTPSTGVNHIDFSYCQQNNIKVKSLLDDRKTLETITASAEFTFYLILSALRKIKIVNKNFHKGNWRLNEDEMRGHELYNKKVGIIGFGRIGKKLSKFFSSFRAKCYFYDPYVNKFKNNEITKYKNLKSIFLNCDVVCVSCYLTKETLHLVNYDYLKLLKKNSVFVNTSRGEVVVEKDVLKLVRSRKDIQVSLDVLENEQKNIKNNILFRSSFKNDNLYITPHIAGLTYESQKKAGFFAIKEISNFFK